MKPFLTKYFLNLLSAATIAGLAFLAYYLWQDYKLKEKALENTEKKYVDILGSEESSSEIDELKTQLAISYRNQQALVQELKQVWGTLLKERHERVKSLQDNQVAVGPKKTTKGKSDYTHTTPEGTQSYIINELRVNGPDSPPLGYVLVDNLGKVTKKAYKFKIKIESAQLKDDKTGKIRVISRAFLIPEEDGLAGKRRPDFKKWSNIPYPLKNVDGSVIIDPVEPVSKSAKEKGLVKLPLNLNVGSGYFASNKVQGSKITGDITLLGYGRDKYDLDWKYFNLGINYSDSQGIGYHVVPAYYRPFPKTLTNTYLGVGYNWQPNDNQGFLGISVGL